MVPKRGQVALLELAYARGVYNSCHRVELGSFSIERLPSGVRYDADNNIWPHNQLLLVSPAGPKTRYVLPDRGWNHEMRHRQPVVDLEAGVWKVLHAAADFPRQQVYGVM